MDQSWNVSLLGRIGGLLPALVGAVAWSWMGWPVMAAAAAALGLLGWFRAAFRPFVAVNATEITVRNPWGSRRIDLQEVSRVEVGYRGLTITTNDGTEILAWAVQKSNLARWMGRRTRADEVADAINAVVESRRART